MRTTKSVSEIYYPLVRVQKNSSKHTISLDHTLVHVKHLKDPYWEILTLTLCLLNLALRSALPMAVHDFISDALDRKDIVQFSWLFILENFQG